MCVFVCACSGAVDCSTALQAGRWRGLCVRVVAQLIAILRYKPEGGGFNA